MSVDAPSVLSRDRIEGMLRGVVCILDAKDKTTTRNVHYSTGLPDEVVYRYKCSLAHILLPSLSPSSLSLPLSLSLTHLKKH